MYYVGGNLFLKLTSDGAIFHSGGNERHLLGMDQDLAPKCSAYVRCCKVVLDFL